MIGAQLSVGAIDGVIFLRATRMTPQPHEPDITALVRAPVTCNDAPVPPMWLRRGCCFSAGAMTTRLTLAEACASPRPAQPGLCGLLVLVVLLAALAMRAQDNLDGALERLLGQQSAARDTIHQITTSAEDATRRLLTLMHCERTRASRPVYADIDAAHRRPTPPCSAWTRPFRSPPPPRSSNC